MSSLNIKKITSFLLVITLPRSYIHDELSRLSSNSENWPLPFPFPIGAGTPILTLNSKAPTAIPPAAPDPARPMKWPEPMLLENKDAPIGHHSMFLPAKKYPLSVARLDWKDAYMVKKQKEKDYNLTIQMVYCYYHHSFKEFTT